jgi:hypothetical protein
MSQAKVALHKHRKKGLPVLGAAGLSLCLGSGAPAAVGVATTDVPTCSVTVTQGHTLREEEIIDITLATFHIFDREEAPRPHPRIAGGACGACGSGLYTPGVVTGACAGGACGGCGSGLHERPANNGPVRSVSPPPRKPTHPTVQTLKRPQERPQISTHQDQNADRKQREADTRTTDRKEEAQPDLNGLVINQRAGQQTQPQLANPVSNSAN